MRPPRSVFGGVPMNGVARGSRSALKVGPLPGALDSGWRIYICMYWEVLLVATLSRWGPWDPGSGAPIQTCPPLPSLGACGQGPAQRGLRVLFPAPVVEELQVQILKLLLNNKDDNGVSGAQNPVWAPVREGCWYWALRPKGQGLARVPMVGPRLRHSTELVCSEASSSQPHFSFPQRVKLLDTSS